MSQQGAFNQNGPTDMEIDRVEKGKGAPKGGKPGGPKGKKGDKGKGKGKDKGGKGKKGGRGGPASGCFTCGGRRFARDCPKGKGKGKHVNQVNQDCAHHAGTDDLYTSTGPPTTKMTPAAQPPANSVRRVRLVTRPGPDASATYVFDNDVVTDFYDDFPEEPAIEP